ISIEIEQIDNWRREAFYFSSSDQMGVVISRALELLLVLAKTGEPARNLKTAAGSLEWERNRAFGMDAERSNPSRRLVYGLCESLEIAVKSIIESKINEESSSKQPSRIIVKEEALEELMETAEAFDAQGALEAIEKIEETVDEIVEASGNEDCIEAKIESTEEPIVPKEEMDEPGPSTSANDQRTGYWSEYEDAPCLDYEGYSTLPAPKAPKPSLMAQYRKNTAISKIASPLKAKCNCNREQCLLNKHSLAHSAASTSAAAAAATKPIIVAAQPVKTSATPKIAPVKKAITQSGIYRCKVCRVVFREKYQLARHSLVHSADRPHSCKECGMSFTLRNELTEHQQKGHIPIKTKMGNWPPSFKPQEEKRHKCKTCGARFVHLQNLTQHQEIHKRYRPYACELCDRAYTRQSTLDEHMDVVHNGTKERRVRKITNGKRIRAADSLSPPKRYKTPRDRKTGRFKIAKSTDDNEVVVGRPLSGYSGFNYTNKAEVCALSDRTRCNATFLRLLVDSVFHGHPDAHKRLQDRDWKRMAHVRELFRTLRADTTEHADERWARLSSKFNHLVIHRRPKAGYIPEKPELTLVYNSDAEEDREERTEEEPVVERIGKKDEMEDAEERKEEDLMVERKEKDDEIGEEGKRKEEEAVVERMMR
ncbi:hypothetical protein PFISCL1PPCAC_29160, partial [Pristionchus fissidentatus]